MLKRMWLWAPALLIGLFAAATPSYACGCAGETPADVAQRERVTQIAVGGSAVAVLGLAGFLTYRSFSAKQR